MYIYLKLSYLYLSDMIQENNLTQAIESSSLLHIHIHVHES